MESNIKVTAARRRGLSEEVADRLREVIFRLRLPPWRTAAGGRRPCWT